jgi:hypothetical protein
MNDPLHSPQDDDELKWPDDFGLYVILVLGVVGIIASLVVLALVISYFLG